MEIFKPAEIPITLYCDGLCEPRNPGGTLCWGWIAYDASRHIVGQGQGCVAAAPSNTNNVAEYLAVLEGLLWAWREGYRQIAVHTDSQLAVNQINGDWACAAPGLQPLLARVLHAAELMVLTFTWIPRGQNATADALSRQAYRLRTGRDAPERGRKAVTA